MLFAMDKQWWDMHHAEVALTFKGERTSSNPVAYGVKRLPPSIKPYSNSGAACISIAINSGAETVIMLGYDCQHTGGVTHWHGSHPKGLGDAGSVKRWPVRFDQLKRELGDRAKIINASRATALTMFDRMELSECLALH
jgi:hypothetical protein